MHFGLVLEWDTWHAMRDRLEAAGQTFVVGPYLAMPTNRGASTLFIRDPAGNHGIQVLQGRRDDL